MTNSPAGIDHASARPYSEGMPGIDSPDEIDVVAEDVDGSALLSIVQTGAWSADGS